MARRRLAVGLRQRRRSRWRVDEERRDDLAVGAEVARRPGSSSASNGSRRRAAAGARRIVRASAGRPALGRVEQRAESRAGAVEAPARAGRPSAASARCRWRPAGASSTTGRAFAPQLSSALERQSRPRARTSAGSAASRRAARSASASPPKVCSAPVTAPWSARSSAVSASKTAPLSRISAADRGALALTVSVISAASSRNGAMLPSPSVMSVPAAAQRDRRPSRAAAGWPRASPRRRRSGSRRTESPPRPRRSRAAPLLTVPTPRPRRRRRSRPRRARPAATSSPPSARPVPGVELDVGLALERLLADDRPGVAARSARTPARSASSASVVSLPFTRTSGGASSIDLTLPTETPAIRMSDSSASARRPRGSRRVTR